MEEFRNEKNELNDAEKKEKLPMVTKRLNHIQYNSRIIKKWRKTRTKYVDIAAFTTSFFRYVFVFLDVL